MAHSRSSHQARRCGSGLARDCQEQTHTTMEDHLLRSESHQRVIGVALNAVQAHPQHALLPYWRQQIEQSVGDPADADGYRPAVSLAILTARYVLPLWQQARPDDNRAEQL